MAIFENFPRKEPTATISSDGLMSKEDKLKLDSMKIPTKVSELINDENYAKNTDVTDAIDEAISQAIENGEFGGGKSAYEYAKEAGYTGTEEEFAKKLASKEFANIQFDNKNRLLKFLDSDGNNVYEPVYIEGGGGGGSTPSIKLTNNTGTSVLTKPKGEKVNISFTFLALEDGASTGDGTCTLIVNGTEQTPFSIPQGDSTIEVSKYLKSGTNTLVLKCSDVYGNYRSLNFTISIIELSITSTFDDEIIYAGDVQFKYTTYGAIEKTVHVLIDDEEYY